MSHKSAFNHQPDRVLTSRWSPGQQAKLVTTRCPNSTWALNWPERSVFMGTGNAIHVPVSQHCARELQPS
jgi:hypothetical protein